MADKIAFNDGQLEKLLASVEALADHGPYWKHFLTTALAIFLASFLGLATALLLDWLKTRRENGKAVLERLENELALLSGANTAIGLNITALIHTVTQQILSHHEQSHAACSAIEKAEFLIGRRRSLLQSKRAEGESCAEASTSAQHRNSVCFYPTELIGSVAAIRSKAAAVMAMRIMQTGEFVSKPVHPSARPHMDIYWTAYRDFKLSH
jgi:hypothetical protein